MPAYSPQYTLIAAAKSIDNRCDGIGKKSKNRRANPFPRNPMRVITMQGISAAIQRRIDIYSLLILHPQQPVIRAKAGIQENSTMDGFPLAAGMTAWRRGSNVTLKNIKNNKTNPFPGNCMWGMIIQRKIADFRRQIDRQSPSILLSFVVNNEDHPKGYYSETLAAERLRKCYDIAPPAVMAYLQSEIDFVLARVSANDTVLELGCGYGRVLRHIAPHVCRIYGIDTSLPSLHLARQYVDTAGWPIIYDGSEIRPTMNGGPPICHLAAMDATKLGFPDLTFDLVLCIQNGISAFHVDQHKLIGEALRVTRKGGRVLFSSYAQAFWEDRLEWFRLQAKHGLIGEIDESATSDGVIVCKDGFTATTVTPDDFRRLASPHGIAPRIDELPTGSLFCEMTIPRG